MYPGAQVVADISYGTWQSVFAGDPISSAARHTRWPEMQHHRRDAEGFQFPPGEPEPAQILDRSYD